MECIMRVVVVVAGKKKKRKEKKHVSFVDEKSMKMSFH